MAKQKIRIRLKAYRSEELREQVLKFPVLVRYQRNVQFIRLFVHHTNTKILVNNLKCAHISV